MACISARLAAVLILSVAPGLGAQSTGRAHVPTLEVAHRNGQSFIMWRERPDLTGETYRIYRDELSPSGVVLATGALYAADIPEGSGLFLSDRINTLTGWEPRYLERYVVPDTKRPGVNRSLEEGEGLLVWTVAPEEFVDGGCPGFDAGSEGCARYRVNVVHLGVETELAVSKTVHERLDAPAPIEVTHAIDPALHVPASDERVFTQYLDLRRFNPTLCAPNAFNDFWGLPQPVSASNRSQLAYAFNYVLFEPHSECACSGLDRSSPVVLVLHHFGGSNRRVEDAFSEWCAWRVYPIDTMATWWFGFAESHDYRTGVDLANAAGETIVNFTEQRLLRMLLDMPQTVGPVDHQRIYVTGWSMGGGGALGLAMRYPNVFAAAYAHKPVTRYAASPAVFFDDMQLKWGPPELALPIALDAPMGLADPLGGYAGTSVWDWEDHALQALVRQSEPMAPFGVLTAFDDPVLPWSEQASPAYKAFDATQRAWGAVSRATGGHAWSPYNDSFTGLPPTLRFDPACNTQPGTPPHPFFDFQVTKSETLPGLSSSSTPPLDTDEVNGEIEWSASWYPWDADPPLTDGAPVDETKLWRVSLRTTGTATRVIDVTPRRIQNFETLPGRWYAWDLRAITSGLPVGAGMVQATPGAILTVENVRVPPHVSAEGGVRVRLAPYLLEDATAIGAPTMPITVRVTDGSTIAMQHLFYSETGPGSTTWGPADIGLDQAQWYASRAADSAGTVEFDVTLPSPQPTYWFQVLESTPEVHATGVLRVAR